MMTRDLSALESTSFDLLVIGGGIFGACAARDAAERGLNVALVERGDFAGATSSQHLKMVHGGIRYLQHADFTRLRESSAERRAWLRTAPHLVQPLPIVVPTYGHGTRGRAFLRAGMRVYDLLTSDRSQGITDPARRVPDTHALSRDEVLREFPELPGRSLTGAGVFFDGQIYHPSRLVLATVASAVRAGACAANYVEVTKLVRKADHITLVHARDALTGGTLEIRAQMVLNAAGPYAERLLARAIGFHLDPRGVYSRDACFVVPRPLLPGPFALAIQGKTRDADARFSRGARHLFLAPWRGHTLVGVWHAVHTLDPDSINVTPRELERFISEANDAWPALGLSLEDVAQWNAGLLPFGGASGEAQLRFGHRSRLVDHRSTHGIDNLVTLIGVRFTTGRIEASRAVDLVIKKLGREAPLCRTATDPVDGGDIGEFEAFISDARKQTTNRVEPAAIEELARNHGSNWRRVLQRASDEPALARCLPGSTTLRAAVRHAVREEMALTLADVCFRRTHLTTGRYPGLAALRDAAGLMAAELGWDSIRVDREIEAVQSRFPDWTLRRVDAAANASAV